MPGNQCLRTCGRTSAVCVAASLVGRERCSLILMLLMTSQGLTESRHSACERVGLGHTHLCVLASCADGDTSALHTTTTPHLLATWIALTLQDDLVACLCSGERRERSGHQDKALHVRVCSRIPASLSLTSSSPRSRPPQPLNSEATFMPACACDVMGCVCV